MVRSHGTICSTCACTPAGNSVAPPAPLCRSRVKRTFGEGDSGRRMGVEFYMACGDCRAFIDLHKWQVVEEAGRFLIQAHFDTPQYPYLPPLTQSPYPLADLSSHCKKVVVTAEQIDAALDGDVPDQPYIRKLTPVVREFAARHRGHRLFLSCDLGAPEEDPWWPGRPGFEDWLDVPGAFRFHQYLPRNLVEVAGFQSWSAVLEGMAREWPFELPESYPEEIEAIRVGFEERRTRRCT
jgi:hypothetical protein